MVDIFDFAKYVGLSLLTKGFSVSPLKLQKLLYYEQAWHMVFFGRENPLFADRPQAWVNGPVYPPVYNIYKGRVENMCDHLYEKDFCEGEATEALHALTDKFNFTEEQLKLVESVINLYGSKTQNQLVFFTHSEKPWSEKREGLMPYERSTREISLDTMYHYYKTRHDNNKAQRT